jgi:hypothetical protein
MGILDFLRLRHPHLYERTNYTIIEISDRFSQMQRRRLDEAGHSQRVRVLNQDFCAWTQRVDYECFVFAVELLDNLPHDKVVLDPSDQLLKQVHVVSSLADPHAAYDKHSQVLPALYSPTLPELETQRFALLAKAAANEILPPPELPADSQSEMEATGLAPDAPQATPSSNARERVFGKRKPGLWKLRPPLAPATLKPGQTLTSSRPTFPMLHNSDGSDLCDRPYAEVLGPLTDSAIIACVDLVDRSFLDRGLPRVGMPISSKMHPRGWLPALAKGLREANNLIAQLLQSRFGAKHMREDKQGWQGDAAAVYLPTTALRMFTVLGAYFPRHQLLLADFDALPTSVPGRNAPVVSGPGKLDYNSYLIGMGSADIFFPTDFSLMQTIYRRVCGRESYVYKHAALMRKLGDLPKTTINDGSNPMLEDYPNFSALVSDISDSQVISESAANLDHVR